MEALNLYSRHRWILASFLYHCLDHFTPRKSTEESFLFRWRMRPVKREWLWMRRYAWVLSDLTGCGSVKVITHYSKDFRGALGCYWPKRSSTDRPSVKTRGLSLLGSNWRHNANSWWNPPHSHAFLQILNPALWNTNWFQKWLRKSRNFIKLILISYYTSENIHSNLFIWHTEAITIAFHWQPNHDEPKGTSLSVGNNTNDSCWTNTNVRAWMGVGFKDIYSWLKAC